MKTRKLICIVTGKPLLATSEYYSKKLEKAGSEENLHTTYICKEAKDLLLKGMPVKDVRKTLKITESLPDVPQEIIDELVTNEFGLKRSTMFSEITSFTNQETDPDVKSFLNNIL